MAGTIGLVVVVLFGAEAVVVGGGGVAVDTGRVSPAVEPASAWLSLGSRPKKKTANIIPTNRATDKVRKAGSPRLPG